MNISVRKAKNEDVFSILEIINYEILNSTVVYHYKPRTYEEQLNWFNKKLEDHMPVLVAEKDSLVIGFGTYGIFRPWEGYKFSLEHSIYINKDYRNLGIGRLIMAQLIALAKKKGYHTMIAGVDASNKKSIQFHEKFGFIEIGTFKEVGYKFNTWLDLVFMQLFLNK